jgi:TPR repeat protein
LAHLHNHHFCHGYLKPSKVLLSSDHRPLLTDYGFGHTNHSKREEDVLYSLPNGAHSPALDVYQFGVLVYLILTETEPMSGPVQIAKLRDFDLMSKIVKHCTATEPEKRPTFPQILDAFHFNPEFIPGIDRSVYDRVAESYFERVYKYAKPSDKQLYDRPVDQQVSEDSNPSDLIRQARKLYRDGKPTEALSYVKKAADRNFPEGLYLYGIALLKGNGISQNEQMGQEFLERAAALNHVRAIYDLGSILLNARDPRGVELLQKLAEGSDPVSGDATQLIARYTETVVKDCPLAKAWYFSAHEKGSIAGTVDYARVLLDERFGDVNPTEAFAVLQRAAARESADAMFSLGSLFRDGRGCEKDLHQAADWYERATELEFTPAYLRLALMYMPNSSGVPQVRPKWGTPLERALEYYEKAVEAKDIQAKHNLAIVLFTGMGGAAKNVERAQRLWKEAADAGFAASQVRYAECIEQSDRSLAIEYYRKAAQQGNAKAKEALTRL